ncbi:zinc finger protein 358-like isoform X2 [Cydia fagiglandana]|uniref:zinc finger protein 358-like isoform X2 n=1 Tax=Cydia fagiglandana TaxID=1458189 RepID=UPI002FEE41DB
MDCQVKMLSVHQFQKTALQGIRNLKYLLSKVNIAPSFQPIVIEHEDVKPEIITIKLEPGTPPPAVNEAHSAPTPQDVSYKNLKIEPPETVPSPQTGGDSGPAVNCESVSREPSSEQPTTSTSTTKATQTTVKTRTLSRNPTNTAKSGNSRKYATRILRSNARNYSYKIKLRKKPLPCPQCDQKLSHTGSLRAHVKKHNAEPSKCDERGAACVGKVYARTGVRHAGGAHEKRATRVTHACDLCGKAFKVKKSLTEHLLTHQGVRPYKCELCPATFSYNSALCNHANTKHHKKRKQAKKETDAQEN